MKPTPDFDPKVAAKKLLREGRSGALATLMPGSGDPYCSLVNVATAADGAPLLLISRLAVHTKNILADPRVSLMIDERKEGDPLQGARVMLMGTAAATDDPERAGAISRASPRPRCSPASPTSRSTGSSSRARIWSPASAASSISSRADILTEIADAAELVAAEPEILAHMNDDHADACRLYATRLLGAPDGDWRCVGCDPEGLELQLDRTALRLPFPQRVRSPGVLRQVLKQMADQARAA